MIRRHSARDEERRHIVGAGRGQSFAHQIFDHRTLKRSDQVESLPIAIRKVVFELRLGNLCQSFAADLDRTMHVVNLDVTQHGSLDAAVGEVKTQAIVPRCGYFLLPLPVAAIAVLDLRGQELHGCRIAMRREPVDDRASGITETEQLCDLVESLAGSVVTSVANIVVSPPLIVLRGQIEMCVPSRDNQSEHGKLQLVIALLPLFQQNRMDVTFEMVDGNQRLVEGEGQSLGVADAHKQRSGKAGSLGDRDRIDRVESLVGLSQRLTDDRHDRPQMLARRQLRNHAAVGLMRGNL